MFRDGGAVFRDGGIVFRNGGAVFREGGIVFRNGGAVFREGGMAFREGGAVFREGGVAFREVPPGVRTSLDISGQIRTSHPAPPGPASVTLRISSLIFAARRRRPRWHSSCTVSRATRRRIPNHVEGGIVMTATLIVKNSYPRKGFISITQLGLKALNLALAHAAALAPRLPEGMVMAPLSVRSPPVHRNSPAWVKFPETVPAASSNFCEWIAPLNRAFPVTMRWTPAPSNAVPLLKVWLPA